MKSRLLRWYGSVFAVASLAGAMFAAPDPFEAVQRSVEPFVESGEIAGAVMLVANRDRVLHLSAVGQSDLARRRAMRTDDIFWIASMTKPITAVCVAILADEKRLAYDEAVEKYLPEFGQQWVMEEQDATRRVLKRAERPITIRELLTHTSGMGNYVVTEPHWTLAEMTKLAAREPLRFPPGSRWGYSTAGIDALGRLVEVISGMSFSDFLRRRVLEPLGMNETTWWLSPEQEGRFARNYRRNVQTGRLEETSISYLYGGATTDRARPPLGGAGLFSTATDLATFYQMLLNGGEFEGKRILQPGTVAEMTRNQIGSLTARPGIVWGLGFNVVIDPASMAANATLSPGSFGHGGAHGTNSWADPTRGLIYVFMIQRAGLENADDSPMRRAYQEAVATALRGP